MSRYYDNYYPPYVSVAERRVKAQKALKKIQAKGLVIEPLGDLPHRTKIATSFWGHAWCKHLESFSDYENRLPRGRTYVRNGSVLHLAVGPGRIDALVQGSSLYEQTITISTLPAATWKTIKSSSQGKIGSLIELLQGKISSEIMTVVTDRNDGLFPKPREIKLSCSCPDYAGLCKHLAAVLYGIGARLDTQPELLFKLRGVDHNDLITSIDTATALQSSTKSRRRVLDSSSLGSVFGIDLETTPAAAPAPVAPASKKPAKARQPAIAPKKPAKASLPADAAPAPKKPTKASPPARKTKAKLPALKPVIPPKITSAAVRKLRTRLGLTRSAFAAKLSVSILTISLWENKGGLLNLRDASLSKLHSLYRENPEPKSVRKARG